MGQTSTTILGRFEKRGAKTAAVALFGLVVGVALVLSAPAWAEAEGQQADTCVKGEDAHKSAYQAVESWKAGAGAAFVAAHARGEKTVVDSVVGNRFNTSDPAWLRARTIAFNEAVLDATGKFISQISEKIVTETIKQHYADESTLSEEDLVYKTAGVEPQSDLVSRVFVKAGFLAERWIDNYLTQELATSTEDVEKMTPAQKVRIFENDVIRKTKRRAAESVSGLAVVKTIEVVDCNGFSAVGVVMVHSPAMKALARAIARGRGVEADGTKKGSPLTDQLGLGNPNTLFKNEFGVRLLRDEFGNPVVVSFGQWAFNNAGNDPNKKARKRAHAMGQARNEARANMSEFLTGRASLVEESQTGVSEAEYIAVQKDGIEKFDEADIIDIIAGKTKVRSKVKLEGITEMKGWSVPAASSQNAEIVGSIMIWSPRERDRVRKAMSKGAYKSTKPQGAKAGQSESNVRMNANDF
ncbi:MAG: DUF6844 domain-containing protein [Alphaproteobacteria bacterium]